MEKRTLPKTENVEKIKKYTEWAKLAAQMGDAAEVQNYERCMEQEMRDIIVPQYTLVAIMIMDNYKDGFGRNTMYRIRHN